MKTCKACNIEKPAEDFYISRYKNSKGEVKIRIRNTCKLCQSKNTSEWRLKNLDRSKEVAKRNRSSPEYKIYRNQKARERYASDPEYREKLLASRDRKRENLRNKYNMSPQEYDALYESQQGLCAICSIPVVKAYEKRGNAPVNVANVDHCHKTGKVRAILCAQCNTGLGSFKDDTEIMAKAITYIQQHLGG